MAHLENDLAGGEPGAAHLPRLGSIGQLKPPFYFDVEPASVGQIAEKPQHGTVDRTRNGTTNRSRLAGIGRRRTGHRDEKPPRREGSKRTRDGGGGHRG